MSPILLLFSFKCGRPPVSSSAALRLSMLGVTAVVHGFIVHAVGHNLGKGRALRMVPSLEGCRVQGNTPGFMLEHFIVQLSNDTRWTPPLGGWSFTVITIQHCRLKPKQKYSAIILKYLNSGFIVRNTLKYCSYPLFYRISTN